MAVLPAMMLVVLSANAAAGVGLVATGADPATSGGLQRRLEAKLAGSVVPVDELGSRLAGGAPSHAPATDLVLQREADRLLEATKRAYYDGNLDQALARIADLDKLTADAAGVSMRDRALMLLWRATVLLEKQATQAAAESPAREALAYALVPELVVDERSFPPQLVELASRVRKTLRPVKLTVAGLPPGAGLRVDDVIAAAPAPGMPFMVSVKAGRHRLQAWAPGFAATTISADVPTDVVMTSSLPLALAAADALALAETAAGRPSADRLNALAKTLGVDVLAVAVQRTAGAPISAFIWRSSRAQSAQPVPPTPAGEDALALWIAQRIAPKPGRVGAPRASEPTALTPSVAAIGAVRTRDVRGTGGGYAATFGGAGARVSALGTWRSWLGAAEVSYVSYALSPVTADLPEGGEADGHGGATVAAALAGGWRLRGAGFSPFVSAGPSFERHEARDLATPEGTLHFFPSHQRVSLDVHAGATWTRAFGVLQARLTVQPWSLYRESPGSSGRSPAPAPGLGWELGLERPRGPWILSGRYRGERRTVGFSGTADAALSPTLRDVTVTETSHAISVTAGRRF